METSVEVGEGRPGAHLLDLPMRDGNAYSLVRSSIVGLSFRPSYEGWKPRCRVPLQLVPNAFRPSYEGWKLRSGFATETGVLLLDLPMRDGNKLTTMDTVLFRKAFRPSYEGWKLCCIRHHSTPPITFRPSYEGWKHR